MNVHDNPALRVGSGTGDFACTACGEMHRLSPFEKRIDLDGMVYDLWLCLNCYMVLNATHLREARAGGSFLGQQAASSDEFYAVSPEFLSGVSEDVDRNGFIDFLIEQYPGVGRGTLMDFGAGRGITAAAAAKHFDKVYAVELTLNVLKQVHSVMPLKDKVFPTSDYLSISEPHDAILSMHVLEHLPNIREILDVLVSRLNPGGALFFQVPMLRKDYLVCVHYSFFNEASCRTLACNLGLEVVGVWFDNNFDFLNCIMRKP